MKRTLQIRAIPVEQKRAETMVAHRPALTTTRRNRAMADKPLSHAIRATQYEITGREPKVNAVRDAMRADDWHRAIILAAKFPRLGDEAAAIMRAREAILRPAFQIAIGKDPAALIEAGRAALVRRFGK